jgi:hypothetical protein
MYACVPENGGGFFEGVCAPCCVTANLRDPPPTHTSRISRGECWLQQERVGQTMCYLPHSIR